MSAALPYGSLSRPCAVWCFSELEASQSLSGFLPRGTQSQGGQISSEQSSLWMSFLLHLIGQRMSQTKPRVRKVSLALCEWCVMHLQGDKKFQGATYITYTCIYRVATLEADRKDSWSWIRKEPLYFCCCCFYRQAHIVAQTGLKLIATVPQPPEFLDYSSEAPQEK